ncbi:hypothetical protein L7F22_013804, partial [Adiantum nelumboides]|nr:hypothetical protein [Adiantum nelumboides]
MIAFSNEALIILRHEYLGHGGMIVQKAGNGMVLLAGREACVKVRMGRRSTYAFATPAMASASVLRVEACSSKHEEEKLRVWGFAMKHA